MLRASETRQAGSPTTDPDGAYAFTGLAANRTYTVAVELPAQRVLAAPSPAEQGVHRVFVGPGAMLEERDFALRTATAGGQSQNASLAGVVFRDANGNGAFDPGETPVGGATPTGIMAATPVGSMAMGMVTPTPSAIGSMTPEAVQRARLRARVAQRRSGMLDRQAARRDALVGTHGGAGGDHAHPRRKCRAGRF